MKGCEGFFPERDAQLPSGNVWINVQTECNLNVTELKQKGQNSFEGLEERSSGAKV